MIIEAEKKLEEEKEREKQELEEKLRDKMTKKSAKKPLPSTPRAARINKLKKVSVSVSDKNSEDPKSEPAPDNDSVSDTSFKIRRQFVATLSSSGTATLTAGTNELFSAHTENCLLYTSPSPRD